MSKSLYALNRIKNMVPLHYMRNLYHTMIQPYLHYGILLWGSAPKKYLHKTEILQKKAIRIISLANYNSHSIPLLKKHRILKLSDLYNCDILKFMYDVTNKSLPKPITNTYTYNTDIHNYNTRQNRQVHVNTRRITKANYSILHTGPKLWSTIPTDITNIQSKKLFKLKIKQYYIDLY